MGKAGNLPREIPWAERLVTQTKMSVYLATIPGAVREHDPSFAQSDDGSTAAFVAILLLVMALVIMMGVLFRSVGAGIGGALNDMVATGKTPTPVKPPPIVPMPSQTDDMFRILPYDNGDDNDDDFLVLSSDIPTVGVPKCFTCGRPINEGDHPNCSM